jgi:hypothetical protein
MDKKGITELKKMFKANAPLTIYSVATAFVKHDETGQSSIYAYNRKPFASLEEEETFKYEVYAKGVMGGKFEKNLINMPFPLKEEEEGGVQKMLFDLNESALENDDRNREYIQWIADSYDCGEHLFVMLFSGNYEIAKKASDGAVLEDESSGYAFTLCSINPVTLEKAGMYFNEETKSFECIPQKLTVGKPVNGFLFPAFNDRAPDIHEMLYFTKKADDAHPELMEALTGGIAPLSAAEQKTIFDQLVNRLTEDSIDYDTMRDIQDTVAAQIDLRTQAERETKIKKEDIRSILTDAGVEARQMANFDSVFEEVAGENAEKELSLENIVDAKFDVSVPDVTIKVKPERTDLVEKRIVDGRKCFVISIEGDIEVNGNLVSGE